MQNDHRVELCVEVNSGKCRRCDGVGTVQNSKSGPLLVDCSDCQGTGRVEVIDPIESDPLIDPILAMGELITRLRVHQETGIKAVQHQGKLFGLMRLGIEAVCGEGEAREQLIKYASEGETSAKALLELLGGVQ